LGWVGSQKNGPMDNSGFNLFNVGHSNDVRSSEYTVIHCESKKQDTKTLAHNFTKH